MVRIAPVRLQYNPKTLWFDASDLDLALDDPVVVRTKRGLEFGHTDAVIEVDEARVTELKTPLKPVVRKATDDDVAQAEEMHQKSIDALPVFKELAAEHDENMHPVSVEFLFDGDKAVFFFEAEERIDFRDLVRKLASKFHIRVDMRQIGVRDEARIVGGIGHCGQELCCCRMGGEFCPVSIRMAKAQGLSLNPQKISGVCGRLMCCLRYEYEAYREFNTRSPKQNAKISTPQGTAKVVDVDMPRELITVKLEGDDKRIVFPLSAMDTPEDGGRPRSIGEAFDEYADPTPSVETTGVSLFDTAGFTEDDKLATPEAHHNPHRGAKSSEPQSSKHDEGRSRRRRHRSSDGSKQQPQRSSKGSQQDHASSKKRSGKQQSQRTHASEQNHKRNQNQHTKSQQHNKNQQHSGTSSHRQNNKKRSVTMNASVTSTDAMSRPGCRSSATRSHAKDDAHTPSNHRTTRRRSHTSGGSHESRV